MALVVEDGTGLPTAESYASVAESDTYLGDRGHSDWAAGSTPNKEAALRRATEYLDGRYKWIGYKLTAEQALDWPRYRVYDEDGFELPSDALPLNLKRATMEVALRELASPGSSLPDVTESQAVISETVSVIEVQYAEPSGSVVGASTPTYQIVDDLLYGLVLRGGRGAWAYLQRA